MNRKTLLFLIASLLIAISIYGKFVLVGYLDEVGWTSSDMYPFWYFSIAWGILYCSVLWIKKLHPRTHPALWLVGVAPLLAGLYIHYMMI